jgi:hypothetical protein
VDAERDQQHDHHKRTQGDGPADLDRLLVAWRPPPTTPGRPAPARC